MVTTPVPLPPVRGRIPAFVGIVLVALTMRTAVGAMSPILEHITSEVPLDHLVLSVIGAAPPLVFGLSGLVAPIASRRLGLEGALLAATVLGGLGHLIRALAPDATVLLAWCERIGPDLEFALHVEPAPAEVADPDLVVATSALNAAIERIARRDPAQYQWTYKRYGRRSTGSTINPYKEAPTA